MFRYLAMIMYDGTHFVSGRSSRSVYDIHQGRVDISGSCAVFVYANDTDMNVLRSWTKYKNNSIYLMFLFCSEVQRTAIVHSSTTYKLWCT